MRPINVNTIMDDPLAGCNENIHNIVGISTLVNRLNTMLQLIRGDARAAVIRSSIEKEIKTIGINDREYLINELQYEVRIGTLGPNRITSEEFENVLINRWFKIVHKRDGEDVALRFVNMLKGNREKR